MKRLVGRPTRLNPDIADFIVECVRRGHTIAVAARRSGVARETIHRWRRKGQRGKRLYRAFFPRPGGKRWPKRRSVTSP